MSESLQPSRKLPPSDRDFEIYEAVHIQHQFEEVTDLWQEARESKYAGIRIRLTTAQARLGVVGGVAAGLAADGIEGIEVPAWQQNWEGEAPAEPQTRTSSFESAGDP